MPVLMFETRFRAKIEREEKVCTIRTPRKRPIKRGDALDLRVWSGQAYRSDQVTIKEARCLAVHRFQLGPRLAMVGDKVFEAIEDLHKFAAFDGFESWDHLWKYFDFCPLYVGVLIQWGVHPMLEENA